MSSSRDNIDLYNNSQYNLLSYSEYNQTEDAQKYSYSIVGADNITTDFCDNLSTVQESEQMKIIENNFTWLKLKLLQNERTISWLDYYKIIGTFDNDLNAAVRFNDMLKNSALIASKSVYYNGEQYTRGDLLYKSNNGQPVKLEIGLSGIYTPFLQKVQNNFLLKWKWFSLGVTNPEKDWNSDEILNENESCNSYTYKLEQGETNCYGVNELINGKTIDERTISFTKIEGLQPIIKWYNNNNEEVFWDFILDGETNSTLWIVNKIPVYITSVVVK